MEENVAASSPPTISTDGLLSVDSKAKRKTRRKGTLSRSSQGGAGETVPLETVLALREQLETLEKTYQQELAGHEKLVRKMKSKIKKQKALLLQTGSAAAATPEHKTGGGGGHDSDQLKEILLLRDQLENKDAEVAKLRQALRTARSEVQQSARGAQSATLPIIKGIAGVVNSPSSSSSLDSQQEEVVLQDAQSVLDLSQRRGGLSSKMLTEVCASIRSSPNLVSINFSRTKLNSKQAAMLGAALKSQTLAVQALTLDRCQMGDSSVAALVEGLSGNKGVTILSLRSNRIAAAGCKALAGLLQVHASLAELDISLCGIRSENCAAIVSALPSCATLLAFAVAGNELGIVGAKALAVALSQSQLVSLDVDGCQLAGEAAVVLLDAVRKSQLTFLNVSRNDLGSEDNAATAVSQMLRNPTCKLRELVMVGSGLSEAGCVLLGEALKKAKCLTQISLWGARLGVSGAAAFRDALASASCLLSSLDLRGVELGLSGMSTLARGIEASVQLSTLDISGNGLGPEGAQVLGEAMGKNSSIKVLLLNGNNIGNDGLKGLLSSLEKNTTLMELSVQLNFIDDQGMPAVARLLAANSTIQLLDFGYNHIGPGGVREFSVNLGKLESLSLEGNSVGAEGAQLLEEATQLKHLNLSLNNLRQEGARAIARLLQKCSLTRLDLRKNGFDSDGAVAVSAALRLNETLTMLDVSDNRITDRGAVSLAETLQLCRQLKLLDLSRNPLGEEGERKIRQAAQFQKLCKVIYTNEQEK